MVINGAQKTFTGRYSFTRGFSLLWKFYWAGARAHEYTKLRNVSLRDVNSLTCITLYFFWGGASQDPSPAGW